MQVVTLLPNTRVTRYTRGIARLHPGQRLPTNSQVTADGGGIFISVLRSQDHPPNDDDDDEGVDAARESSDSASFHERAKPTLGEFYNNPYKRRRTVAQSLRIAIM